MKEIKPIIERIHPIGNGIHKIYRFKNNYGASVVRFKVMGDYGSYTNNEKEWELAVIKFNSEDNEDFSITYDTKITTDVIGHLTDKEVNKILKKTEDISIKEYEELKKENRI